MFAFRRFSSFRLHSPWGPNAIATVFRKQISMKISKNGSEAASDDSMTDDSQRMIDCEEEFLYRYTAGRWLWNESAQLAARYVRFNVWELCRIAAQAMDSSSCVEVTKLSEGNFNKALLLRMNDGKECIAKIPNPNVGRAHDLTASEVATMEFARNLLSLPAPKIYSWSSNAGESPVGVEYIIMEKMTGIKLTSVWETMHSQKRLEVVRQLVQYDKSFATCQFPAYGGLYHAGDVTDGGIPTHYRHNQSMPGTRFVIGPTNNRKFFDDGRGDLSLDRGPWHSSLDYVLASARRERDSINKICKSPRMQGLFNGPGQYHPSKALKLRALDAYMEIAWHLLPKDKTLHKPALWHSDLHAGNIFVDPDEPTRITGLIDWQAVHIAPLSLQVRHPGLLDFDGPIPEGLQPLRLPENFDHLNPEEQLREKKLLAAQSLWKLYEVMLLRECKEVGIGLQHQETLISRITGLAGSLFTDGEPVVLGYLMRAVEEWNSIVGEDENGKPCIPCPIGFDEKELKAQQEAEKSWKYGVQLMDEVIEELGVYNGWDGLVDHDQYEVRKKNLREVREGFLDRMAASDQERTDWIRAWPFPCEDTE